MSGSQGESRPTYLPSNPGIGPILQVGFANGERNWSEEAQLVDLAAEILAARGYEVTTHEGTWLEHPASGYLILPQVVGVQPLDHGGVRTTTTIQVHHPTLIPAGLFEYQHSAGDSAEDSIRKGFDQWAQVDFVTLLDAALPQPKVCMTMVMSFPEQDGRPARHRRAILGPIAHYQANPPAPAPEAESAEDGGDSHSFCPCCLVTRSFEAFKGLFEADEFVGLRLFTLRDAQGSPLADCRLNGDDYEPGAIALREYVTTWPDAGYEFRKQYVILQTIEEIPDMTT